MPGLFLFDDLHFLHILLFSERLASEENRNAIWYIYILRNSKFLTTFKYERGNEVKLIQKYEYRPTFSLTADDLLCKVRVDRKNAIIEEGFEILNEPICITLAKTIWN